MDASFPSISFFLATDVSTTVLVSIASTVAPAILSFWYVDTPVLVGMLGEHSLLPTRWSAGRFLSVQAGHHVRSVETGVPSVFTAVETAKTAINCALASTSHVTHRQAPNNASGAVQVYTLWIAFTLHEYNPTPRFFVDVYG